MKTLKKNMLLILMFTSLISLILSRDVSPVLSIRYDNLASGIALTDAIGLQMDLGSNRFTGFDTDGTDYRIYMGWKFGKVGFGHDGAAGTEYTIGANYEVLENISLDLDYVINTAENLRLGMQITF